MKYLIVGLGNPGYEYSMTRHNVGFKALDCLAGLRSADGAGAFKAERLGDVARIRVKNKLLTLLKPSTFMNLSGKAVAYWMQQEGIPLSNVLVVVDDIALGFGTLRLKGKGSDGGHNGLKDICRVLGTPNYSRLRVGVGGDFGIGGQVDYVLGEWTADEKIELPTVLERTAVGIEQFVLAGLSRAMNTINQKGGSE